MVKTYKKAPDRRHNVYKRLLLLVSGIPATGQAPVTPPRDKAVGGTVPGPRSTGDPLPLSEHRQKGVTLLYTAVTTGRSKRSSTTSVKTFQRERGPKHLFPQFHLNPSLREVQSPQMQAQTEEESGCTSGTTRNRRKISIFMAVAAAPAPHVPPLRPRSGKAGARACVFHENHQASTQRARSGDSSTAPMWSSEPSERGGGGSYPDLVVSGVAHGHFIIPPKTSKGAASSLLPCSQPAPETQSCW